MENCLYYKTEASHFEEALPIGNGRLGAMVYGKCGCEKISINEDTLWTGTGKRNPVPPDPKGAAERARRYVSEGRIWEAQEDVAENFNSMWSQMYLPLGNIYLDFGHDDIRDYMRSLDFTDGICKVSYKSKDVCYTREIFSSYPGDVIALKLLADKKGVLGFKLKTDIQLKVLTQKIENKTLVATGLCPSNGCLVEAVQKEPIIYTEEKGIGFTLAIKIDSDGDVAENGCGLEVRNASEAVVYISVKTSFNGYDKNPDTQGREHYESAQKDVSELDMEKYTALKEEHQKDFSALYSRVGLDLESPSPDGDIFSRLDNFDGSDFGLYELLFGYGRYLTISSSRQGTQATNLQGIWNEDLPPKWNCGYTTNMNTEMNYWPTLPANLKECFEPFVSLNKNLTESGKQTARDYYGARGSVSHHNTDIWAMTNPVGYKMGAWSCLYSFWNMSSGWMCCQLYDLYEYTLDKEILKEIYPVIRDNVLFYSDILYKDDEGYMICPSTSPENKFTRGEQKDLSLSKTTTMTACILKELFARYLTASEILGADDELTQRISEVYPDLYSPKIGSDGRLLEWAYEETETEPQHRHASHMYSLYPGNHISVRHTPDLAEACRKSLIARGDDGTGWSLAWKVSLWAYLKDGNHALEILKNQLRLVEISGKINYAGGGGTYPNLFDAHPPFQIDGNFGATAAICNMLMQSEIGYIELLPALPDSWKNGRVHGIVAKGNVEIDMEWKNNEVVSLILKSPNSLKTDVCFNGKTVSVNLIPKEEYKIL